MRGPAYGLVRECSELASAWPQNEAVWWQTSSVEHGQRQAPHVTRRPVESGEELRWMAFSNGITRSRFRCDLMNLRLASVVRMVPASRVIGLGLWMGSLGIVARAGETSC
jgi:hypothetical protein